MSIISSQELVAQLAKHGMRSKGGMNVKARTINPCAMPSIVIRFQESKKENTSNLVFTAIPAEASIMITK